MLLGHQKVIEETGCAIHVDLFKSDRVFNGLCGGVFKIVHHNLGKEQKLKL